MEKKNFMSLLLSALVIPMYVNANTLIFTLIAPVLLINTPFRLIGAVLFLFVVLIESLIVSKLVHVGYTPCVKRMLLAKIFSFLVHIIIFIIIVLTYWHLSIVSDEYREFILSKITLIKVVIFIVVMFINMLLQYHFLSKLHVARKKLIKAIVFANIVTYSILILLFVVLDYFKLSLPHLSY
ncbi:MAG TPA: hypothetical protein VLG50_01725 [Candidatus Saccharimonadales bacterium]|nr:hypothetical protein [Candidatus Saccharimonadales bacterium]